jgi:rhamnose transport system permease protein
VTRIKGLLIALILLGATMSALSPYFLTPSNLLGLTRHLAEIGLIACGMTFIIATGGIDLSVGSLLGLCCITLGYVWQSWGPVPGFAFCLLAGLIGGFLNSTLVARYHLPPLIVTLATMALFRGLAMVISKAQPISQFPSAFAWLGQGDLLALPTQLWVWILIALITFLLAHHTPFGRQVTAIGTNLQAATIAALPVARIQTALYIGTGFLCALAAIIFTSRVATAKADAGLGLELEVITAVVLGGTPITGGRCNLLGTCIGVLILGIVRNGLSLGGISTVWQAMLMGSILIITAIANRRF